VRLPPPVADRAGRVALGLALGVERGEGLVALGMQEAGLARRHAREVLVVEIALRAVADLEGVGAGLARAREVKPRLALEHVGRVVVAADADRDGVPRVLDDR